MSDPVRTTPDVPQHRYNAALANEIEAKWQDRWDADRTFWTPNPVGDLAVGFAEVAQRRKLYVLDMFPYPSGTGLHVGHPLGYIGTDVYARFMRMQRHNVLHSMGYDAFGLPAEQYAVQTGTHPRITTEANIANMKRQLRALGLGHDPRSGPAPTDDDYYRMCLKKTSWYTCIYPSRVGALIATEGRFEVDRLDRFGWYLGAAFQIQDDLLNLVGDYGKYGKEISGDLLEGKRTLMLIHLLRTAGAADREEVRRFLGKRRRERTGEEVRWLHRLLVEHGSLDFARQAARDLAGAALAEGEAVLRDVPDSEDKSFLLATARYVIERDR